MRDTNTPTGAETLVRTLTGGGVDVCFTNPGTSEMHFVGALDRIDGMRCVLGLFEGVVTGAADGYYRIADKPAATLLHLAPGLANGLANLHNAKKARSGIVNIVGDHATYHSRFDSPLSGDVEAVARPMSGWVRTTTSGDHIASDAAEAIRMARQSPGKIATLILPADVSWGPAGEPVPVLAPLPRLAVSSEVVAAAAEALVSAGSAGLLLLGNIGVRARALELAGKIAAHTGCRLMGEIQNSRTERGAGRVSIERVPYTQPVENALRALEGTREMVLAGAAAPIAFFAYPDKPVELAPPGCAIRKLASVYDDIEGALEAVVDYLGIRQLQLPPTPAFTPGLPEGKMSAEGLAQIIATLMPENAIVVDESVTSGRFLYRQCRDTVPHDWLSSMGGSIGFAPPSAIGAAIAAPDRKVLALTGDGSGMYTLQSLWTMARESLNVTVIVFANRKYEILRGEFALMGTGALGPRAEAMLTIGDPALDWCALATGHGVENGRATDLAEFAAQLKRGLASKGPYLIEVVM